MKEGEIYYTGVVIEVVDKELYEVTVDIPGIIQGVKAYPMRGEIDEPKKGDLVLLKCLDPVYQSYYLYQKLKEDKFIGFRSNGKMVDITPDKIRVGIFDQSSEYKDSEIPELTSYVEITSEGVMKIVLEGDCNIEVNGNATINSPKVKITGGELEVTGTSNNDMSGPFNCIPTCPFSGAPHSGSKVTGT